jgi:hypothetical protein
VGEDFLVEFGLSAASKTLNIAGFGAVRWRQRALFSPVIELHCGLAESKAFHSLL